MREGKPDPRTALLLIAHGSRLEEANADLACLVAALRRRVLALYEK